MGVSENRGTPKSSILMGFSIINHPFWVSLFLATTIFTVSYFLASPSQVSRDNWVYPSQKTPWHVNIPYMDHMGKLVVHRFFIGLPRHRNRKETRRSDPRGFQGAGEAFCIFIKSPNPRYDRIILEDLGVRYKIKYSRCRLDAVFVCSCPKLLLVKGVFSLQRLILRFVQLRALQKMSQEQPRKSSRLS